MADDYPLDDPLLHALRNARPVGSDEQWLPDTPIAAGLFASIVAAPPFDHAERRDDASRAGVFQSRRRIALAVVLVAAVVFVAVALAGPFGGFSNWLTGEPGHPASTAQQKAFDRATRSWAGFPAGTQLRLLAQTSVGGATYTLYGFRVAGALCLRLVVSGNQSVHQLACPPLSLLRSTKEPAVVAVADYGVGHANTLVSGTPVPFVSLTPEALVTLGIVADGVRRVEVSNNVGKPEQAVVSGDAFLAVDYAPSFGEHLSNVWALAGGRRVAIPFALPQMPFTWASATGPALSVHGPAKVQHVVLGGTIGWLVHHDRVGIPVPKTVHYLYPRGTHVIFEREIAPNPAAPERMVVGVVTPPAAPGVLVGQQVCEDVVGGRYSGGLLGCWPASQLFATAPTISGDLNDNHAINSANAPFNWTITNTQGSVQYATIAGLASDAVARMRLYLGTGQQEPVALHDNGYIVEAPSADFPLRLVAYDAHGLVVGLVTFAQPAVPAGVQTSNEPAPGAHWRLLIANDVGKVFAAASASGGTCYAIQTRASGGSLGCQPSLPADGLRFNGEAGNHQATITIETGTAVTRVVVHYQNGHSQTLIPTHGVVLERVPASDETTPSAVGIGGGFTAIGIVRITALNAKGQTIGSQSMLPRSHRAGFPKGSAGG